MAMMASRDVSADIRYINPNAAATPGAGLAGKYKKTDPVMTMDYYKKARHLLTDEKKIKFHDARSIEGGLRYWKFDTHGLEVITPPEPVDFENDKLVKEEYYPKLAEIVKKETGCKDVIINSHLIRMPNPPSIFQNPAKFAHCDASKYNPPLWHKELVKRKKYTQEEMDDLDVCMVNVWHPRKFPAFKDPLCLLDTSSVDLDKEIQEIPFINLNGEHSTGFPPLCGPSYNPNHRWVYIPDQKPEEAWIFKQFDERNGVAKQAFHNSFVDPFHVNDPSKPGRESVEFRMYLIFPKKAGSSKVGASGPWGGDSRFGAEALDNGSSKL